VNCLPGLAWPLMNLIPPNLRRSSRTTSVSHQLTVLCFCSVRDQTQGLIHARQVLYH
jgi:hypothetical protein